MKKAVVAAAGVFMLACVLLSCAKNIDNKEAVTAAIQKRVVKTGFNLDAMSVDVQRVSFHENEAQATVSFYPKGSAPSSGVTFKYNLRREKDEWVVVGPASGENAGHPGMAPSGGAPSGGIAPGPVDPSQPLPPGHPATGSRP